MNIGDRVLAYRATNNLTMAEMDKRFGLKSGAAYRIEHGLPLQRYRVVRIEKIMDELEKE